MNDRKRGRTDERQGEGDVDGAEWREQIRAELARPLAYIWATHENKAGGVSGAWEGIPDTLAHVTAQGHGATRVFWQKVRWGSDLHGTAWKLLWREGESFEIDETPVASDEDIEEAILRAVRENPGASVRMLEKAVGGKTERQREIRARLLESGALVNLGSAHRYELYLPSDTLLAERAPGGRGRGALRAHHGLDRRLGSRDRERFRRARPRAPPNRRGEGGATRSRCRRGARRAGRRRYRVRQPREGGTRCRDSLLTTNKTGPSRKRRASPPWSS